MLAALVEEAEKELAALIPQTASGGRKVRASRETMSRRCWRLRRLRPAIDKFFDKVMVMVEDEPLRANRLALLGRWSRNFPLLPIFRRW